MTIHLVEKLKLCPFCGNDVVLEMDTTPVSGGSVDDYVEPPVIWCPTCDRAFDFPEATGYSLEMFVTWWNTRPVAGRGPTGGMTP